MLKRLNFIDNFNFLKWTRLTIFKVPLVLFDIHKLCPLIKTKFGISILVNSADNRKYFCVWNLFSSIFSQESS
jgi:hypothetical protein